jgi:hypothetical protein
MTLVYRMGKIKRWISQVVTTTLGKVLNRLDFKEKGEGIVLPSNKSDLLTNLCPLLDISIVIT